MGLVRISATAEGTAEAAREWARALSEFDPARAAPLKIEGASGVYSAVLAGQRVVVKTAGISSLWSRGRHLLRLSPAWRQWRGAAWLHGAGFAAARGRALGMVRRPGGSLTEVLVLEHAPGDHALQVLADGGLSIADEQSIARAIGAGLAAMLDAGLVNRDHKLSNLIIDRAPRAADASTEAHIAIVDTVGVRRTGPASRDADLTRMLAAMLVEALGCGVLVRLALRRRLLREYLRAVWGAERSDAASGEPDPVEFTRWERGSAAVIWDRVAEVVRRHAIGPPRVSPLRPPRS